MSFHTGFDRPAAQEEQAAQLCLLAPARLEHLIPPMPRMMHAVLRALRGSDQSVAVALKVRHQALSVPVHCLDECNE